jgi:hypothetical protein
MAPFTDELYQAFAKRSETGHYEELRSTYEDLLSRKLDEIPLPDPAAISVEEHAKVCCAMCQQALLHRSLYLFQAAMSTFLERNLYATTLCIRGHCEATGSLGHVYKRLVSCLSGNITLYDFHDNLWCQVVGSRNIAKAPRPININTMITNADKALNREIFGGENRNMLTDGYGFLCEFAHPNFHSYPLALQLDWERGVVLMRRDQGSRDEEFHLIGYLNISNRLFVDLFDRFGACVGRIGT